MALRSIDGTSVVFNPDPTSKAACLGAPNGASMSEHITEAKVITTASQKGGSGKSTATISTGVRAQQVGFRAAIIDIDPQGSSVLWGSLRQRSGNQDPPHVVRSTAKHLAGAIAELKQDGFDVVFVDTPGVNSLDVDIALRVADLVILPCEPSVLDLQATRVTFDRARRLSPQAFFLLNKVQSRGTRVDDARACLSGLSGRWLTTPLPSRVDHKDAVAAGLGVTEYNPMGQAASEIMAIWDEIEALLGLVHRKGRP